MDNLPTTATTLDNVTAPTVTITTTILQFPVFWDDMNMAWNETELTWNQGTDSTSLTNL